MYDVPWWTHIDTRIDTHIDTHNRISENLHLSTISQYKGSFNFPRCNFEMNTQRLKRRCLLTVAMSLSCVRLAASLSRSLGFEVRRTNASQRGELEAKLMDQATTSPLAVNTVKGAGGGGGFAKSSGNKKAQVKTQAAAHAKVLKSHGVVRIDNVLTGELADKLRERVYALREDSEAKVAQGTLARVACFADVLLKENRCDMTLPLDQQWAIEAMASILVESPVGSTLEKGLGKAALLREWSCLMSDPGSSRQVVHPDTPFQKGSDVPVLYTCFVALQDVSLEMGPTTWLPRTHTQACHDQFFDETLSDGQDLSPKDKLLKETPIVLGLLPKGSCAIFDSRLLHCGGANHSPDKSRALMYCSFQNPKVTNPGNPGSIRREILNEAYTLSELMNDLKSFQKGKAMNRLAVAER